MSGFFITFEGPDGGGKTTQVELLNKYLIQQGFQVVCTREPGGTEVGNAIRSLLLDPAFTMGSRTEALLYMAARAEHVERVIRPALAQGKIVISDRFADSTFVYQGIARKLIKTEILAINHFATQGLIPDITVVLDGTAEALLGRMQGRGNRDRIEQEDIEFHRKVRQGFLELAATEPQRVKLVSACEPVQAVHRNVLNLIQTGMTAKCL